MKTKLKIIIPTILAIIAVIIAAVCISFTPNASQNIEEMFSTAQKYLVEQNYEQAVAEFNKIIELDPMNADAYLGLAQTYIEMGDTEKAVETLEKGLEMTGDERLKALLEKLWEKVGQNTEANDISVQNNIPDSTQQALEKLNRIISDDPQNEDAWLELTSIYFELGCSFANCEAISSYESGSVECASLTNDVMKVYIWYCDSNKKIPYLVEFFMDENIPAYAAFSFNSAAGFPKKEENGYSLPENVNYSAWEMLRTVSYTVNGSLTTGLNSFVNDEELQCQFNKLIIDTTDNHRKVKSIMCDESGITRAFFEDLVIVENDAPEVGCVISPNWASNTILYSNGQVYSVEVNENIKYIWNKDNSYLEWIGPEYSETKIFNESGGLRALHIHKNYGDNYSGAFYNDNGTIEYTFDDDNVNDTMVHCNYYYVGDEIEHTQEEYIEGSIITKTKNTYYLPDKIKVEIFERNSNGTISYYDYDNNLLESFSCDSNGNILE